MNHSAAWEEFRSNVDFEEYATRWDRLEAAGNDVHGEVDFVMRYGAPEAPPTSVLDAGCGAGRVASELAKRGVVTTGVDLDSDLLRYAEQRSSDVTWRHRDLADLDLGTRFDCVVLAGNVLPYVDPLRRADVVAACANHLQPDGRLVVGMNLRPDWPSADELQGWIVEQHLKIVHMFAGWNAEAWPLDLGTTTKPSKEPGYIVVVAGSSA